MEVIAVSLSDYVDTWIKSRLNLSRSTISGYTRLHRLYIAETRVGGVPIEELTEADMVDMLRPLIERGCTRQAQLLQVLVSAALRSAVRRREICFNPMDSVDHVKHCPKVTSWLSVDQAKQLLSTSAEAGDPYYVAWLLMLCCGLRRGEMLALRWSDIDEARMELHIQRQAVVVDRVTHITRPKSLSSVRDIPLDADLLTILRLIRRSQEDIILPDCTRSKLADALDRALMRARLPRVTLHGLRHTMASVAAEDGVQVKILQSLMGHAHYQTTADIYAHVNQRPRMEAARLIVHSLIPARLEIV